MKNCFHRCGPLALSPPLAALVLGLGLTGAAAAAPVGLEVRVYPAGAILGADWRLGDTEALRWGLLASYNVARRDDAGRHENEEGGGPGVGIYVEHPVRDRRWFWGGRVEFFQLDIDWRDLGERRGSSKVSVLQPTLSLGYRLFQGHRIDIDLAAHLGAEINIQTQGESVGEGAIGLLGMRLHLKPDH